MLNKKEKVNNIQFAAETLFSVFVFFCVHVLLIHVLFIKAI